MKNWTECEFEDVIDDITAKAQKVDQSHYLVYGNIPIIDQGRNFIAGYTNDESLKWKGNLPIIIFGDHTRNIKYIDFPFVLGADGTKVLQVKSELLPIFAYYQLLQRNIPSAGYNRHYKYLKELKLRYPSKTKQIQIASVLQKADRLRRMRRYARELSDGYLQSVFLEMFGDPETNQRNWSKTTVDEISFLVTDGEHITPNRTTEGVKLLSARNIQNGFIDFSAGLDFIPIDEYIRIKKRCNPEFEDILISCSGSIGRVTTVHINEPFTMVRSVALIKPNRSVINPYYLEYFLRSPYSQKMMEKFSKASSQPNLFQGPIKELPVLLPDLHLQEEFANYVNKYKRISRIQFEASRQAEQLFQSLLRQAFEG